MPFMPKFSTNQQLERSGAVKSEYKGNVQMYEGFMFLKTTLRNSVMLVKSLFKLSYSTEGHTFLKNLFLFYLRTTLWRAKLPAL